MPARRSFAFRIDLRQVGPVYDPAWQGAAPEVRKALMRAIVVFGLEEKDRDLAQGLDKDGNPMAPISPYTRAHRKSAMGTASPSAPPLTPAYGLSRTRSLLDGRAMSDHAEFFWRYDEHTQKPWSRILDYHRRGGRLPVRDVIGASPAMVARVRERVLQWWANYKRAGFRLKPPAEAVRFAWEGVLHDLGVPMPLVRKAPAPVSPPLRAPFALDADRYTFGIGADREAVIKAAAEGRFSGFSQRVQSRRRKPDVVPLRPAFRFSRTLVEAKARARARGEN